MANKKHLEVLAKGAARWNAWRAKHPDVDEPDLSFSRLPVENLAGANLAGANLRGVVAPHLDLQRADLSSASLIDTALSGSNLEHANLEGASLHKTDLSNCQLQHACLRRVRGYSADFDGSTLDDADLTDATFEWCDLSSASLCRANLTNADLTCARLIATDLTGAVMTGATVYGVSAWAVTLDGADQRNLVVSAHGEPVITVDDLELAFFIYQILEHGKVRELIDAVTSRGVLLLGRFTPERKRVLHLIRDRLRELGYVPIVFDFDQPAQRDLTETITTLARLSRFIVADLTEPASIPKELEAIAPRLAIPIQPLLQGDRPFSMFADSWKYDWILQLHRYEKDASLLDDFEKRVTQPAEAKWTELAARQGA